MKTENSFKFAAPLYNSRSARAHSHRVGDTNNLTSPALLLTSENLRHLTRASGYQDIKERDRDSCGSLSSAAGRIKRRSRNFPMKSSKCISKKSKTMDYTNYAYNEAVGRLKIMLADNSYVATTPKFSSSAAYLRNFNEDSGDNFSDNLSVIERPVYSDISKYLSPSQKSRLNTYRPKKTYVSSYLSASKENLAQPPLATALPGDSVQAPVEIFNFIEKQEDYIEQLEKESKYCRNELTNLLGKVKDVINENEQLTENVRSELNALPNNSSSSNKNLITSSDSDEYLGRKTPTTPRKSANLKTSPRYASAPNIVYEARISELEAELMQAHIDLKRLKAENEELKRKPSGLSCETHRRQIEQLQQDKTALEGSVHQLQRLLDDAKSQQANSSKRYVNDLISMERSQAELEVRHLRDELDRQHERVRELQHEMARRLAEERASAERRYNNQVDQLGGDLSSQWEQVAKLQLELERQKRYESDLKRDVANRNSQIEELKMELRANRTTFLADMAQVNAEKQSLEQEITALRMQLDRSAREGKTETARLTAEITSLRQRLDRGDADLLHSKREVLRLNDEIANLEKELAYGELKNEIRPTKKDLDKRISEMQDKHAETVNELEEMITSQKQLMDKLTSECKTLTGKLEDTTYRHNEEKQQLRGTNEQLMVRLKQIWSKYKKQLGGRQCGETMTNSESEEHFLSAEDFKQTKQQQPLMTTSPPLMAQPQPLNNNKNNNNNPYYKAHHYNSNYKTPTSTTNISRVSHSPSTAATTTPPRCLASQRQWQETSQSQLLASTKTMAAAPLLRQTETETAMEAAQLLQQLQQRVEQATSDSNSTITMTKISRTTLEWAKSNSSWNANENASGSGRGSAKKEIASYESCVSSEKNASESASAREKESLSGSASKQQPSSRTSAMRAALTSLPTTLTTALTPITIHNNSNNSSSNNNSSNTTQMFTIPAPMDSKPTMPSNMAMTRRAEQAAADMTTAPPTTGRQHINMKPRQRLPQPSSHNNNNSSSHSNNSSQFMQQRRDVFPASTTRRVRRPRRARRHSLHRPEEEEEEQQQLEQEQRAAYNNRARAAELWGTQLLLEQTPAANPLCHNSLPRPLPSRSSWSPEMTMTMTTTEACTPIQPLELDFSISSPSLMRSSASNDDETCSELANLSETFDVDEDNASRSVSLTPTTILTARRASAVAELNETMTIEVDDALADDGASDQEPVGQPCDIANETVTIERDFGDL